MKITDDGIDAYTGVQFFRITDIGGEEQASLTHMLQAKWVEVNCKSHVVVGGLVRDWPDLSYHFLLGFTDPNEALVYRLTF